jgi:hypothetical protein
MIVTACAAAATVAILGFAPSASGAIGVFLLYTVAGTFFEFLRTLPPTETLFGRIEYDVLFNISFVVSLLWSQTEFLRPPGHARMTFNQASLVFCVSGLVIWVFDYLVKGASGTL